MIEYSRFRVKNGKVFKDAEIPLKDLGIVAIQGKNGTGKSSIFDLLQVMHYGKTPGENPQKKDQLVRNNKESEWELEFDKGEDHYIIKYVREKHGKSKKLKWKYEILCNGEDITPHNQQTDVPKELLRIVGLSQKEYEGSVHLTQEGQHILISGKPSARKEYISNFFDLDSRFDEVLEAAKRKLKETKEEINRISQYSHSRDVIQEELKDIQLDDLDQLNLELDNLKTKIAQKNNQLADLNQKLKIFKDYNKYSETAFSITEPEKKLEDLQNQAAQLSQQLEQQQLAKDYNEKARINNEKIESLKTQLSNIGEVSIQGDIQQLNQRLYTLNDLKQKDIQYKPFQEEFDNIPESESEYIDPSDAEKTIHDLKVQIQTTKNRIQAISNGECPTCGHQYSQGEIEQDNSNLSSLTSSLSQWEDYYTNVNKINDSYNRKNQLREMLKGYEPYTEEMEKERTKLENQVPLLSQKTQIERDLENLEYRELMPEIDSQQYSKDLYNIQQEQKQVQEVIQAKNLCPEKPEGTLESVQNDITTLMDEIIEIENEQDQVKSKISVAEEKKYRKDRLEKQLADVRAELNQLEYLKKQEFLWSKMVDAYGPKGLRVAQLNRVMDLLMERLPYFVNLLFSDNKAEFYHKCDAGNISIMYRRTDEEGTYDVDVSQMSGGEKKRMAVALILALADCVPMHKRSNILILDEIDGQLDEEGKNMFSSELLPALKNDYNSIFIISHDKDVKQADVYDQVWYFTKPQRNHYTRIDMRRI